MDLISGYQVFLIAQSSSRLVSGQSTIQCFWNVWRCGAQGFNLTAADFSPAPSTTTDHSPTQTRYLSARFYKRQTSIALRLVELTTVFKLLPLIRLNDNSINYDTLPSSMRTKVSNLDLSVYLLDPAYVSRDKTSSPFWKVAPQGWN